MKRGTAEIDPADRRGDRAILRGRGRVWLESLEPRTLLSAAVVTYHNDIASSGVNSSETLLTPTNLTPGSFGKQFSTPVDGQIYAQPLYVPQSNIAVGLGQGTHNVAFVATEHDTVYAIDADGGNVLWKTSLLDTSNPAVNLLGAAAIAPVTPFDVSTLDLSPEIGITATPVIDRAANLIYVEAKSKQTLNGDGGTHYVQMLYKIDITTGAIVGSTIIGDTSYIVGEPYIHRVVDTGTGTDPFI